VFIQFLAIKGEQRAHVIAAKSKIDAIIKRGRFKQSMTHFVSLPMVNPIVIENYLAFKVPKIQFTKLFVIEKVLLLSLMLNVNILNNFGYDRIWFLMNVASAVVSLNFYFKIP